MKLFNEDHLGSEFKEESFYYSFKSAYELGMKSILSKKEQRLSEAILSYNKFKKTFPDSEKTKEVDSMGLKLQEELNKLRESLSTISQNN